MDLELNFVPHYSNKESMAIIIHEGVKSSWFYVSEQQEVFTFAVDYYVRSNFVLVPTLDVLRETFPGYFSHYDLPVEPVAIDFLIDRIRVRFRRNQTQDVLRDIAKLSVDNPDEALIEGLDRLSRIQFDTSTKDRNENWAENFPARVEQYFNRVLDEQCHQRGFYFGWDAIDEDIFGIKAQEFAVVVGAPNVGKSFAMSHMALAAARHGVKVYFASLENSKDMTLSRLDVLASGISGRAYERGNLTMTQTNALKEAREEIEALERQDLLVVDCPRRPSERTVWELYARARYAGTELFVGDQLSWVTSRDHYRGDRSIQISEIATDIADLCRQYNMASIWASQFNREGAKAERGKLHQIALSTTVEQVVDMAVSLSRNDEMKESENMLLEMMKSRRSEPKTWLMDWHLRDETKLSVRAEFRDV